jgi:hypothetical protein
MENKEQIMITKELLVEAQMLASKTTSDFIKKYGEQPFGCGFAWVECKVRSNSAVGKLLQEFGFKKSYTRSGLSLWNPSNSYTQDMEAKLVGAQVYAEMLSLAGLECEVRSRLD